MVEAGHADAPNYTLGRLADEAELVVTRYNARLASEMTLLQMVISSQPNQVVKPQSTKSISRRLQKILRKMAGE